MLSELDRDYRFEPVWSDGVLSMSRGYRLADSRRVLLLAAELGRSSQATEQRLAHAYALRSTLDERWAATPFSLVPHCSSTALLSADPGGQLLVDRIGSVLDVGAALRIAAGLASALAQLHAAGLLHHDIRPANILCDEGSGQVWLLGFGSAERIGANGTPARQGVDGSQAYMAPERTGRRHGGVGARSDLYSLGVTLYELFSGHLPFSTGKPSEGLHETCEPQPLAAQGAPPDLARLVMQLLRKAPEDRYQTAAGVELDLRRCLEQWERGGHGGHPSAGGEPRAPRTPIGASLGPLDLATVVQATQAVSGEIVLERLLETLMTTLVEHTAATRGLLILPHADDYHIAAEATPGLERPAVVLRVARMTCERLPESLLRAVIHSRERVLLDDTLTPHPFSGDAYLRANGARSLLCLPLTRQNKLLGVLYLENRVAPGAFGGGRLALSTLLASQAAISLENARLYADLQLENADRRRAEADLARALDEQRRGEARLAREKQLLDQIARSTELPPILDALCGFVEALWPERMALVLLADAAGERLHWRGSNTTLPRGFIDAIEGCAIGLAGPCPTAAFRGKPVVLADIAAQAEGREFAELCARFELAACWSTPVFSQTGRVLGTLAVYSRQPGAPTADQRGALEQLTNLASIAIERAQSEAALRRGEMLLLTAQRLSLTGSFGWNVITNAISWSDETYRIYDLEPGTIISMALARSRVHPDDAASFGDVVAHAAAKDQDFELSHRLLLPNGRVKHLHVVAHAVHDEQGKLIEYTGAVKDVSEQRCEQERLESALAEREALLKEVHHRVKNNLQLISSLLNLQASRTTDPAVAELFADSRNRVRSMALVHENLYRAGNFAKVEMLSHIENLCAHLARAYGLANRQITLSIDVSDLRLELDAAICCGLIINELVSNALKHAFPEGAPGQLSIQLRAGPNGHHVLSVADDGIGLGLGLERGDRDSLGLSLVRDLTAQLHGTLAVQRGAGTTFRIEFAEAVRSERRS